jgi:two-component system sensor histidine kinase KdpD
LDIAAHHLGEAVGARVKILLTDPRGRLIHPHNDPKLFSEEDWSSLQWVLSNRLKTGRDVNRRSQADGIYLPLIASQGLLGILAFYFPDNRAALSGEQMVRLETFASQVALALERNLLSRQAEDHRISAENEKNRSALLSAVSHDLRTPLTAIQGAAGSLLANDKILTAVEKAQLSQSIYEESDRMNRLVQNLLDMTRLESGALHLKKEWQSVEELVGAALDLLKGRFSNHPLALKLEPGLPLVLMDGLLMEQLLLNLLENALNHTPPGTPIELSAQRSGENLELEVSDRGPGLLPGEENSIFEKFNRGSQPGKSGVGLGLSICRGIANAHGGIVSASIRPGGGASFLARLPIGGKAPDMKEE